MFAAGAFEPMRDPRQRVVFEVDVEELDHPGHSGGSGYVGG
jgi:hypothetical protein